MRTGEFIVIPGAGKSTPWRARTRHSASLGGGGDAGPGDEHRDEAGSCDHLTVWKPMHLQPVFSECEVLGFGVSEHLFQNGFCIPSGSALTDFQRDRVVGAIRAVLGRS
jgi:hypothetical protein